MAKMLLTTEEARLHAKINELESKLIQLRAVAGDVYDWAVLRNFAKTGLWKRLRRELERV